MKGQMEPFNDYSIPRVSQLTQRSNQFNLRTQRYNESEIIAFVNSKDHITFQISLQDKYGEYGIISLLILEHRDKELFIDTWIMSCRVLKRDVEKFVMNRLVKKAKELNADRIVGEYLETRKNGIVKDHFKNLGFLQSENKWVLNIEDYEEMSCEIDS